MSNIGCKCNCIGMSLIASIAVGIIAAILQYTAVITIAPVFYWVVFGIAVAFLAITFLVANRACSGGFCLSLTLSALLIAILGTIATALVLLGVGFAATSVIGAIFVGILFAFFSFLLLNVACATRYSACAAN